MSNSRKITYEEENFDDLVDGVNPGSDPSNISISMSAINQQKSSAVINATKTVFIEVEGAINQNSEATKKSIINQQKFDSKKIDADNILSDGLNPSDIIEANATNQLEADATNQLEADATNQPLPNSSSKNHDQNNSSLKRKRDSEVEYRNSNKTVTDYQGGDTLIFFPRLKKKREQSKSNFANLITSGPTEKKINFKDDQIKKSKNDNTFHEWNKSFSLENQKKQVTFTITNPDKITNFSSPNDYLYFNNSSKSVISLVDQLFLKSNCDDEFISYDDFYKVVGKYIKSGKNDYSFGNVANENYMPSKTNVRFAEDTAAGYYFLETNASRDYARTFIKKLFNNSHNRDILHQNHLNKLQDKNKQYDFPMCASFIHCKLNGQNFCLIALSKNGDKVYEVLKQTAKQLNYEKKDANYIVIIKSNQKYKRLLQQVSHNQFHFDINYSDTNKGCTEKFYLPVLLKLLIDNPRLYIDGVVNTQLYLFNNNKLYGKEAALKTEESYYISNVKETSLLILDGEHYTGLIPCCSSCRKFKSSVLELLSAAKAYGEQLQYDDKKEHLFSPLRNNL